MRLRLHSPRRTVAIAIACSLAAACSPYRVYTLPADELAELDARRAARYRSSIRPCTDGRPDADPRVAESCTLAIVELDDQGELWRPAQLTDALELIARHSDRSRNREAIVVVFIHGWKNDASPANERDGNLGSFKRVLEQLAAQQLGGPPSSEVRHVVGVYLAWSGLTARGPLLKQLSFFGRKSAAERVARVSLSHVVHRIVAHAEGVRAWGRRGNPASRTVVVGHSFGGLILENTLLRSLTQETDNFADDFPADLAVLVNPANEAILARQSIAALTGAPPAWQDDLSLPLIVSMTSEGDAATRRIFPIGQWIKAIPKRFRRYAGDGSRPPRQRYYYTHTPGHAPAEAGLRSHLLSCPQSPGGCRELELGKARMWDRMAAQEGYPDMFAPPAIRTVPCPAANNSRLECIETIWTTGVSGDVYQIDQLSEARNRTPYWVLRVPRQIVPDHSGIFGTEFVALLAAFVNLPQAQRVESLDEATGYLQNLRSRR